VSRIHSLCGAGLCLALLAGCGLGDAQSRLRSAVDEKYDEYNQCYAQALVRDEGTEGTLDAVLYVDKVTGSISDVTFNGGAVSDPDLQRCLTRALGTVQVEGSLNRNMEVGYTFEMRPVD